MAAAGIGRRSGKATAAAAAARSSLGLGPASAFVGREHARSSASGRSRSARGRRRGAQAKRRGGGAAVVRDAADPRSRRSDVFVCPSTVHKSTEGSSSGASGKRKLLACEQREDARRRRSLPKDQSGALRCGEQSGVLSDSENEEPVSRRIRRFSAFVRRSRASSGVSSGAQRSRSCTEASDSARGTSKGGSAPAHTAGAAHSFTAGILLSSENSRSASAPVSGRERWPFRRGAWLAAPPLAAATPPAAAAAPPERSVSPESNDSISEELNHFKPIVCSPCTPPKRLADGRLLEPALVKATPRNLSWRLHKPTSYEASPAVLRRWRQIELDRQSFKVDSKATLTSPVADTQELAGATAGATAPAFNKRKLLFDAPDAPALKIRVPAVRRGVDSRPEPGPAVGSLFGRRHSFSPCARQSSFRSCKLAPKDPSSPRKETTDASQRGGTTKRRDDAGRQERRDRALALRLQRRFERESAPRPGSPDTYFLRSWMANRGRRRRGLRRSCRISQQR